MGATAEAYEPQIVPDQLHPPALPPAVLIPEMAQDRLVRQRAARFIGDCIGGAELQVINPETSSATHDSLHDAIQHAAQGDEGAKAMIQANAHSDVIERTIKAGHIMQVRVAIQEDGSLAQNGQYLRRVQHNSLVLAQGDKVLQDRTEAEARNTFRAENLLRQGLLDDNYMVVLSRAPVGVSDQALSDRGFFADTKSFVIQVLSRDGDELVIESAFVAGVDEADGTRRDEAMVVAIGDALEVDLRDLEPDQLIDAPLLVSKATMPHGSSDLVQLADEPYGTFFGQQQPPQGYDSFREVCAEREQKFVPKAEKIMNQLVSEASKIKTKEQAIVRLHELSEREMVQQAVFDESIDPRVFGSESASHIHIARRHMRNGELEQALRRTAQAVETAHSSSCPTLVKKAKSIAELDDIENEDTAEQDCEFVSKECPVCKAKNVMTKVTKSKITGSCGCSVSKS